MLPTNEKAILGLYPNSNELTITHDKLASIPKYQHLYILSDEEIKDGDWFIWLKYNTIHKATKPDDNKECKKIIATTDSSLLIPFDDVTIGLPQIPKSFIETFVNEYNKGNIITEVMIEYEKHTPAFSHIGKTPSKQEKLRGCYNNGEQIVGIWTEESLKTNPENTINIKPIKDSWSREEVIELIQRFNKESAGNVWFDTDEKWIEENI